MPATAPVTASAGAAANAAAVPASRVVSGVTVKQEPIGTAATHTVQKPGVATTATPTTQVGPLLLYTVPFSSNDHSEF